MKRVIICSWFQKHLTSCLLIIITKLKNHREGSSCHGWNVLKILIRNSHYLLKFISKLERKEPFRSALTAAISHGGGKVNVLRCLTCGWGALGFHLAAIRLELQLFVLSSSVTPPLAVSLRWLIFLPIGSHYHAPSRVTCSRRNSTVEPDWCCLLAIHNRQRWLVNDR